MSESFPKKTILSGPQIIAQADRDNLAEKLGRMPTQEEFAESLASELSEVDGRDFSVGVQKESNQAVEDIDVPAAQRAEVTFSHMEDNEGPIHLTGVRDKEVIPGIEVVNLIDNLDEAELVEKEEHPLMRDRSQPKNTGFFSKWFN